MAERQLILDADRFPSNTLEDRMARSKRREEEEKRERPKVEKVIEGGARKRKATLGQKFKETFFMEETDEIAKWVRDDVILPTLRDALFAMVTGSLSMALFGTVRGAGRRSSAFGTVDYNGISSGRSQREARSAKARHTFEDLTFDAKYEADDVLEAMRDMVDEYGQVSIADMYELAGVSSDPIDRKWGWTSLRTASVIYSRDGYIIDLPKTKPVEV